MNNEREIKFRAWDKDKEEMLTPDMSEWCINFENGGIDVLESNMNFSTQEDCYISIENYELMEFTGLKDKNGKEIYEGDILECDWNDTRYPIHNIGPVKWDNRNACWRLGEGGTAKDDAENHFKVIGNIYENPELLTKL